MNGDAHAIRANLPDVLVGLGGAGKRIVYEYMESEWILEEGLEPREDQQHPDFDAFVVDVTHDEHSNDEIRVERINDRLASLADRLGRDPRMLETELTSLDLLDGVPEEYATPTRLTSPSAVRDVAKRSGIRSWWLDDSDELLLDSYDDGLLRRRALGKALYCASVAGDDPLAPIFHAAGPAQDVAVVVGLGGGTGSGMLFDVARRLADAECHVTLFAVLPGEDEGERVKANAHAALSELEHLSRTNRSPFNDVILLPFGAADDPQAFDEAAAQSIVAHSTLSPAMRERLDPEYVYGPPRYAPFTIPVPRTARFSVDGAERVDDRIRAFLDESQVAHKAEHALYDELEAFVLDDIGGEAAECLGRALAGNAVQDERFRLNADAAAHLQDRFERLRDLLDEDYFGALDYRAASDWREMLDQFVDDQLQGVGDDPVDCDERLVTKVGLLADNPAPAQERYPRDERDQLLDQYVRDELTAISRRAKLYRTLPLVDDEFASGIEAAMEPDVYHVPSSVQAVAGECADALDRLGTDLDLAEQFRADADAIARSTMDEWAREVGSAIETVATIDGHRAELERLVSEVRDEIHAALDRIEAATDPAQLSPDPFEFRNFDEMNTVLANIGASPIDGVAIGRSLQSLAEAKRAKLEAEQVGWLSDVLFDRIDDYRDRFVAHVDRADDRLFDVEGGFDTHLNCSFTGGLDQILDDVHRRRDEAVDEILTMFERRLTDPPIGRPQFRDAVGDEWEGDIPDVAWPGDTANALPDLEARLSRGLDGQTADAFLDEMLDAGSAPADEPGPVYAGLHAAIVGPVDALIDDLDAERESVERRFDRIRRLEAITAEDGERFAVEGFGPDAPDPSFSPEPDTDPYVETLQIADPPSVFGAADLVEAGLHQDETRLLAHRLETFANEVNVQDERLPLDSGHIEVDDRYLDEDEEPAVATAYDDHLLLPVFMGRAFRETSLEAYEVADDIEATLRHAIGAEEGQNGYQTDICPFGGPWDTSLVTFVGGVFLDNLQPVQGPNGYAAAYKARRDALGADVRVHHAHGLDGCDPSLVDEPAVGAFVVRDRLLDLDDPREVNAFVDTAEDERLDLFEGYTDVTRFDSTIDLEFDD